MDHITKPMRPIPQQRKMVVSQYFLTRMYFDQSPHDASEFYNFQSLDNVPDYSCKYDIDPEVEINFHRPPATEEFEIIELPLVPSLYTLGKDDCLKLNPARYDRVKKQISQGILEYPWMTISNGHVHLMDGRHRVVAMLKILKRITAPFIVEKKHILDVRSWLHKQDFSLQ